MITHKFREVMAFADEVTILRRGKLKITRGPDKRLATYWLRTDEREHARTAESYGKQF